jgi:Tfp pilus assembly protein PilF
VIKLRPQYEAAPSAEGRDYLSRAYMMKGNKHAEEAKTSSTQDNGKLFALAAEQYEAALVVKPDAYEVLNNWGVLLHEQSKRQPDEATAILARSVEMYDGAVQIKPDYYEALLHRGIVLANLAVLQQGKEAEALSARSIKDFNAALEIKPNSHEALTEWGSALRKLAKAQPEQAEILLNQATQKYQDALKIKPDYVKALNAWGDVLLLQADAKEGDEQESLVEQAMNKFFEADTRRPGSSAYSLARYKALIGDDWGCRESLERAKRYNQLPPRAIIRREPRFDSVRGSDWFEKLLQSN